MNIEKLAIDIVQSYQYTGFTNDTIEERELYLCMLTCCLLNHVERTAYDDLLLNIFSINSIKKKIEIKEVEVYGDVHFKNNAHESIFKEFFGRIDNISEHNKIPKMFKENHWLVDDEKLMKLKASQAVELYDRVLQRLQSMNSDNRLSTTFDYEITPFDFSEFVSLFVKQNDAHHVYDPYATTGESAVAYALLNPSASITVESVLQTSSYIRHKLILAGASQIDTKHSFSLSPNSNVLENSFDVAFTLLEPKESNTVNSNEKLNLIRLEKDTVPSKFKEHGFIQHILYSLKDDGIGIVFIGKGPLNRVAESNARQFLLENNFVDAIIQLPPKLITSRTVPLFALILRKTRKPEQPIKFINATSFTEPDGARNKLTDLKLLAKAYHAKSNKENFVSLVLSRDISTDGYPLNVSNYVSSDLNEERDNIDLMTVRKALQKQQKTTDELISKLLDTIQHI